MTFKFIFIEKGMISYLFLALVLINHSYILGDNIDLPPEPEKGKPVYLPKHKSFSLENGLKVYLIEEHKLPSVSFFLYFDYLPKIERKKSGLGEFTAALMKQGAGKRTKFEIDEELDFTGTDFNISENLIYANGLTKHSRNTLSILSDIIRFPSFSKSEFEKLKENMISKIQSDRQEPERIVSDTGKSVLYGDTHPYGEVPSEESINNLQLEDCQVFHEKYFKPNIAHLAIMGDMTLKEAKELAETYFGSWKAGSVPKVKIPKVPKIRKTVIYLVDRPDSVQSVIKITHPIKLFPKDKDLYSAIVMNTMLGGGTFRLYQNLRENHGYTYGVYSSLVSDRIIGNFSVDLNTQNLYTYKSIKEILNEFRNIRKFKPKEDELQLVKNFLVGQFSLSLESPATIAMFAIKSSLYDLPSNFYENYIEEINKVSGKDILKAAKKYITPDRTNIIIVGKKSYLAKELKKLRRIKVVEIKEKLRQK